MSEQFQTSRRRMLQFLAVVSLTGASSGAMAARGRSDTSTSPLSEREITDLTFMREEEKVARDVYIKLNLTWGWQTQVFANISESEQRHMDAIKKLLDKYSLSDPVQSDIVGSFTNPELKAMYEDLVLRGSASMRDALHVGALIEEVDIIDLVEAYEASTHSDIKNVYANLQAGSRDHLRAFVGNIQALGETYVAQVLSQELVDEILATTD